jgi:hypothetical protein
MDHASGRSHGCRLTEYTHRRLAFLCLENETLRVTVLLDKGADIVEFLHKPTDTDFLFQEPGGIRAPGSLVSTIASPLGENLDFYEGGWHECLPGGGPAVIRGAPEGLHGEAALLPWSMRVEEDAPEAVSVTLSCRLIRFPLSVRKRLTLRSGSPVLRIEETITNEGGVELDFLWGQHPTFGKPFLDEHCLIQAPARTFSAAPTFSAPRMWVDPGTRGEWPLTRGRDGKEVDLGRPAPAGSGISGLLCLPVEEGWYAVTSTRTGVGFGLAWDRRVFPYLFYWHVYNGVPDYPWFNRVYVAGLEPWTSTPMSHDGAVAAGTACHLAAGASLSTFLTAAAYAGRQRVKRITPEGEPE